MTTHTGHSEEDEEDGDIDVELSTHDVESLLQVALESLDEEGKPILEDLRVLGTFDDYGLLTRNRGLILRSKNGEEFQLKIVRSR
jgi:hypothetical protein